MRFNSSNQNWVYIALESPVWILIIMTLSQLDFFKVLVFGKVCFNLIKLLSLLLYLFFLSSIIFYFFRFFVSFVFIGVRKILPKENQPPVRVRVWVSFRVKVRIGGKFSSETIVPEPFLPVEKKEIFYMPTKSQVSSIQYMYKAAPFC